MSRRSVVFVRRSKCYVWVTRRYASIGNLSIARTLPCRNQASDSSNAVSASMRNSREDIRNGGGEYAPENPQIANPAAISPSPYTIPNCPLVGCDGIAIFFGGYIHTVLAGSLFLSLKFVWFCYDSQYPNRRLNSNTFSTFPRLVY